MREDSNSGWFSVRGLCCADQLREEIEEGVGE